LQARDTRCLARLHRRVAAKVVRRTLDWVSESPESCHSMRGADRPPTAPSGATGVARRPAAFTLEEASLVEVLLAEHSRLLADRDDLDLVAERTTISVRRST
jgi:hypothetical protein